jgi:hypothetical protein
MEIADFELERYFARWEFDVDHLLCASDPEPVPMGELLAMADPETERLWADLRLGYTESAGHPLPRAQIARTYQSVDPEHVLVCSGAREAIFVTLGAMLGPGDHAVVVWPSYQSLHEVARAAGAEVSLLPLEHDQGWALDLERLRAPMRPTTRAVVVNFPHSPTGALPPASTPTAWRESRRPNRQPRIGSRRRAISRVPTAAAAVNSEPMLRNRQIASTRCPHPLPRAVREL